MPTGTAELGWGEGGLKQQWGVEAEAGARMLQEAAWVKWRARAESGMS